MRYIADPHAKAKDNAKLHAMNIRDKKDAFFQEANVAFAEAPEPAVRSGSFITEVIAVGLFMVIITLPLFFVFWTLLDVYLPELNFLRDIPNEVVPAFYVNILINKDNLMTRWFGKGMLDIAIVDSKTGEGASPWQRWARNLTLFVFPLEVLVAFISPARRLGDYLAGTALRMDKDRKVKTEKDATDWILALFTGWALLSFVFTLLAEI